MPVLGETTAMNTVILSIGFVCIDDETIYNNILQSTCGDATKFNIDIIEIMDLTIELFKETQI